MRFYVAAHSRNYAALVKNELERRGHECTSRWIADDTKFGTGDYCDSERQLLAVLDEQDVRDAADGLILLAESRGHLVPGGKHVETGIALALGHPVYVIGDRENIFHWHPRVRVFPEIGAFFSFLEREQATGSAETPSATLQSSTDRKPETVRR
jgi:hypothetical protein